MTKKKTDPCDLSGFLYSSAFPLSVLCMHKFRKYNTSSPIQTILSAPESHRIMPVGSRAVPPVGNHTPP